MDIQLIKGEFTAHDAIEIMTQIIHAKIKFQEGKINESGNEEDSKMRETRIKQLQKNLYDARHYIEHHKCKISLESQIHLV